MSCGTWRSATRTRSAAACASPSDGRNQLVERLAGERLQLIANLGVNGYTSADLVADELPRLDDLRPDFVSLLVGVNDVVHGMALLEYADTVSFCALARGDRADRLQETSSAQAAEDALRLPWLPSPARVGLIRNEAVTLRQADRQVKRQAQETPGPS